MDNTNRQFDKEYIKKRLSEKIEQDGLVDQFSEEMIQSLVERKFEANKIKFSKEYQDFLEKNRAAKVEEEKVVFETNKQEDVDIEEKESNYLWVKVLLPIIFLSVISFFFIPDNENIAYIIEGAPSDYKIYEIEKDNCTSLMQIDNPFEFGQAIKMEPLKCNDSMSVFSSGIFVKDYYQIHESLIASSDDWSIYNSLFDEDFEDKKKMDAIFAKTLINYCKFKNYLPNEGWHVKIIPKQVNKNLGSIHFGSFFSKDMFVNPMRIKKGEYANAYALLITNNVKIKLLILETNKEGTRTGVKEDVDITDLGNIYLDTRLTSKNPYVKTVSNSDRFLLIKDASTALKTSTYLAYADTLGNFQIENRDEISGTYQVFSKDGKKEEIEIEVRGEKYYINATEWTGEGNIINGRSNFEGTWRYKRNNSKGKHQGSFLNNNIDVNVIVGNSAEGSKVTWIKKDEI